MKKLKDILNEVLTEGQPQTKIFDQGALNNTVRRIEKLVGTDVEYTEHRFGDGTGGFSFKWEHGVKHFGNLGVHCIAPNSIIAWLFSEGFFLSSKC